MGPLTVRTLIPDYDPEGWIRQQFADSPSGRSMTKRLPSVPRETVADLLADQVEQLLDMNMLELLVAAWMKQAELRAAIQDDSAGQLVTLFNHRMASTHEPEVKVTVNGAPLATVALKFELELELSGVQLLVQRGRVREVRVGELAAAGIIELEGHELKRQRLMRIDLPGIFEVDYPTADAHAGP